MAKLWAIIKREYVERVRSKWFVIATLFGPIFFSAIIIVPAWLASKSTSTTDVYNTTILDATGTPAAIGIGLSMGAGFLLEARFEVSIKGFWIQELSIQVSLDQAGVTEQTL